MAEGFEFLRVRETGTKGSNFFASQHQAQKGTSETVTRFRIFGSKDQAQNSGLFWCSKKGRFLTHARYKNARLHSLSLPFSLSLHGYQASARSEPCLTPGALGARRAPWVPPWVPGPWARGAARRRTRKARTRFQVGGAMRGASVFMRRRYKGVKLS